MSSVGSTITKNRYVLTMATWVTDAYNRVAEENPMSETTTPNEPSKVEPQHATTLSGPSKLEPLQATTSNEPSKLEPQQATIPNEPSKLEPQQATTLN
ncbi:hypothetical protein Fmac_012335 [Flemingia macrophylla]|uniref:Uncharacterized protein n=1 Tax=Flemingia macrophylla TaxID=520843 RepID=A0ABD1MPZ7_9FABA